MLANPNEPVEANAPLVDAPVDEATGTAAPLELDDDRDKFGDCEAAFVALAFVLVRRVVEDAPVVCGV